MNPSVLAAVSVVIPCFRCATTIDRALASVTQQSKPPAEIVLVQDPASQETATPAALERITATWSSPSRLVRIDLPRHSGASAARNAGWEAATQPWLAWLDADDAWDPRKLEVQTAWLAAHPQVALCGHLQGLYAPGVTSPVVERPPEGRRLSPWRLLCRNGLTTSSVLLRRDLPHRFDTSQSRCEDHRLWAEIALDGQEVWRLELCLAWMFKPAVGAGGLSADRWAMRRGELAMYRALYQSRRIGLGSLSCLVPWSLAKHVVRSAV
jgi:glycosyltransferase involved in cell wall biosynthesis